MNLYLQNLIIESSILFILAGPITNYYSKLLTIDHINVCTSSYFGVVDPQCSMNFQENLKVFDNGVPNFYDTLKPFNPSDKFFRIPKLQLLL